MFQMVACRLVSSLTGRGLYVSRAGVAVALPGPGGSGPQELTSAVDGPEVASRWTAISSALTQTQAVQNASIPPESWTGAAEAASSEIQALGGKLSDLAGAFPGPANSLKTWEDRNNQGIQTVEGLQQQWDYAREVGPQMLDDLDKAANSKEQLTEAQVKKLQDKWGKDLQNPFCVQAMADAYRAKHGNDANFSDMLNRLAVNTAGPAYIPNESERATMASFTERIGTAMVLSTGGINASGAEGLGRSETYALMKDRLFGQDGSTKISQIETSNIADIKASFDTIYNREPGTGWQITGYDIYSQATGYAAGKNPDLAYSGTVYEGGDNSLAAKLVTYDHDYQRGLETKRVMDGAVSWPIVNHTTKDQDLFNQVKDPLQSLYLLSDTPDSMQGGGFHHFASRAREA